MTAMITIDPIAADLHPNLSRPTLNRFLKRARTAIDLPGTVSVLLTSDAELKRLNRTFRGKNKPTDVLSFPADLIPGLPSAHRHAGDLAISLDTAARQAGQHGHTLAAELRILLLHGLLHLSGLDHETDSGQMTARESELRIQLRLPNSLIARTQAQSAPPQSAAVTPAAKPSRPSSQKPRALRTSTLRAPARSSASSPGNSLRRGTQ